jgi:hypothetical protein
MRQEDIIKFFKHVASRESSHGVKDAFRFKKVLTSRKKGMLLSPKYKDPDQNPSLSIVPPAAPAQSYTSIFRFHNQVSVSGAVTEQQNSERLTRTPSPPRIRPRPRYKNSMNDETSGRSTPQTSGIVPDTSPTSSGMVPESVQPLLTLDPAYQCDPLIQLDPTLDPDLGRHSRMDRNDAILTPWMDLPNATSSATTTSTIAPVPDITSVTSPSRASKDTSQASKTTTRPARMSQRLKGKADLLAIEEAKKLLSKGKSRR